MICTLSLSQYLDVSFTFLYHAASYRICYFYETSYLARMGRIHYATSMSWELVLS